MAADLYKSPNDIHLLLESLGAPKRLIRHLELVGEAGDDLIASFQATGIQFDENLVRLGIAVDDAGKILHLNELTENGSEHEPAGQKLMLENNVPGAVARCCVSHAQYESMDVSFEELIVALSDKLWKGKRVPELELLVIDEAAKRLGKDRWDIFETLDGVFETIASSGDDRLSRSVVH